MGEHEAQGHGHVHLGEADWKAMAAHTELEGEVLLGFVTATAEWIAELRGATAPAVRRVLDIGSGPGVGTCELARLFPDAQVVAVDGSPAMLEWTARRAAARGLDERVTTHLAELPDGVDEIDAPDVIWASQSLHHVGDETNALRLLGGLLAPSGLLAIAESAEPMRFLPDDLGVGSPGFAERLRAAQADWFAAMRGSLPGSVPSDGVESMVTAAGLQVVGVRVLRQRFDPPLSEAARRVVVRQVGRARHQLEGRLDDGDLSTVAVLSDADDPRSILRRPDAFLEASRQIVIARR
jgi:SAM-dependent methyltransferase